MSVFTNGCKVAGWESVQSGAWWCLFLFPPLPVWPLTAIETSCVKQSLLSLSYKVQPFASLLLFFFSWIDAFSTVRNFALPWASSAFDYSYYHKLLLLAYPTTVCVCVYLSLDLFLGPMCLSPPDCNPVVVGSTFHNSSLGLMCVCACACLPSRAHLHAHAHRRHVIYQRLTTVGPFTGLPTVPWCPQSCRWTRSLCPTPALAEANTSRAEEKKKKRKKEELGHIDIEQLLPWIHPGNKHVEMSLFRKSSVRVI